MLIWNKLFENKIEPDIEELLAVIRRQAMPRRVHHIELAMDEPIKEQLCKKFGLSEDVKDNEPFATIKRDIRLHEFLGYDAFLVEVPTNVFATIALQDEKNYPNHSWKTTIEHIGPIQSWQDFESYPWPNILEIDFSSLEWLDKNLPENMGCYDMTAHILELTTWLMGYESFCYKIFDAPDLVDAVLQKVGEFYVDYTDTLCDFNCIRLIWGADDMGFRTSTMVSAQILKEKILHWHKRCAEISHEHGRPYLLHSCGNLEEIMSDLIEDVKIDAKHSYEDAIMPVTEAKKRYGGHIAILGGIDVDFLCRADEDAIRKRVRETLNICMPGGGYCLGTGNSVADYIPIDNYLVMLDEGRRFILNK
jgi:uroporphyrinogen decarboxylase